MTTVLDWAGAIIMGGGAIFSLIAAISLFRFPDLYSRMHAVTKPQVFGLILLLTGLSLIVRDVRIILTLVLVLAFQLITAPISAHMLGRAGYRTGTGDIDSLEVDELTEDIVKATVREVANNPEEARTAGHLLRGDEEIRARQAGPGNAGGNHGEAHGLPPEDQSGREN